MKCHYFVLAVGILILGLHSYTDSQTQLICGTIDDLRYRVTQGDTVAAAIIANMTTPECDIAGVNLLPTIEVVVHRVHYYNDAYGNETYVTDTQIQNQINALNYDFGTPPTGSPAWAGTPNLYFHLNRISDTSTSTWQFNDNYWYSDVMHASTGGYDAVDNHKYMNIWICRIGTYDL
ncbi:MAG: hypothetical protein ACHQQQ_07855 [Bacteroidota bacterium]